MKRAACALAMAAIATMLPEAALCKPPDERAAKVLSIVKEVQRSGDERMLSEAELEVVLQAGSVDNPTVRMSAAYATLFTVAEAGQRALNRLRNDSDAGVVGVVEYVALQKRVSAMAANERLAMLSFALGDAKQSWAGTLIISSLGDKYRDVVVPMFLLALEKEKNALVRAEMLFQAVTYGNDKQLKAVTKLLAEEKQHAANYSFAESTVFFLNAVSKSPYDRRAMIPLRSVLSDVINARMKKKEPQKRENSSADTAGG